MFGKIRAKILGISKNFLAATPMSVINIKQPIKHEIIQADITSVVWLGFSEIALILVVFTNSDDSNCATNSILLQESLLLMWTRIYFNYLFRNTIKNFGFYIKLNSTQIESWRSLPHLIIFRRTLLEVDSFIITLHFLGKIYWKLNQILLDCMPLRINTWLFQNMLKISALSSFETCATTYSGVVIPVRFQQSQGATQHNYKKRKYPWYTRQIA